MRRAGILLPITSLPSPWGIGTMGDAARNFIEFLSRSGQSFWQILPICPTGFGNSPYQSFSSYAGNPYLIDLDDLCRDGLLCPEEYQTLNWGDTPDKVDYGLLYRQRFFVLRKAVGQLKKQWPQKLEVFCQTQRMWINDYALFMTLKEQYGGISWYQWPDMLRCRDEKALDTALEEFSEEIEFWKGVQYLFYTQWNQMKEYAAQHNISIIGDLPIYVAGDSADVWAHPEQFQLDENLHPVEVAGCPPDGFSKDGQLWGNPLFHWEKMKKEGYRWWIERIAFQLKIYDILRIDHFRGFDEYYAIPSKEATAKNGRWRPGPGIDFFQAVEKALGHPAIIAEDLGFLTASVRKLLEDTGFPGMKVLQFAFNTRDTGSGYLPHFYTRHCVAYTGTHDNDTILGWIKTAPEDCVARAKKYLRLTQEEGYHWGMMRSIWASVADLAIVQMQDLLGLGSEGRMNTPSTLGENWTWRCRTDAFDPKLADQLRYEMELYERLPEKR